MSAGLSISIIAPFWLKSSRLSVVGVQLPRFGNSTRDWTSPERHRYSTDYEEKDIS